MYKRINLRPGHWRAQLRKWCPLSTTCFSALNEAMPKNRLHWNQSGRNIHFAVGIRSFSFDFLSRVRWFYVTEHVVANESDPEIDRSSLSLKVNCLFDHVCAHQAFQTWTWQIATLVKIVGQRRLLHLNQLRFSQDLLLRLPCDRKKAAIKMETVRRNKKYFHVLNALQNSPQKCQSLSFS